MAQVCKWLSFYLCMRDSPKTDMVHPDGQAFDAVIVWRETPKEKPGYLAYEVILKPACTDSPVRPPSPPKERPLSQEFIQKKLKDAEERRQSVEMARLQAVAKDKERLVEANQRIQELNQSFSKEAEKKLVTKLEGMEEKKNAQMKALQERLQAHAKKVAEVHQMSKMQLKEKVVQNQLKIEKKMEARQEKRDTQLRIIQGRLKEHEKQIQKAITEVEQSTNNFSKNTEEKLVQKMQLSMKNREDQLKNLMERLQDHEKHIQDVRDKKLNASLSEEKVDSQSA